MIPSELPDRPSRHPDPAGEAAWRSYALEYVRQQLGARAPTALGPAAYYDASVLEGDGPVVLFPFSTIAGDEPGEFFVVVGNTVPNYYPRWSLTLDEAFRVHLGTRFMLVVEVAQASESVRHSFDPRASVEKVMAQIYPGEPIESPTVAAMFEAGDELHVVCRCRIAGEDVYVMAGDCTPGFYRRTELPPHVVYRLHLGSLLLREE